MERVTTAWAIIWRMTLYGVGLGALSGAICGPLSMIIGIVGYVAETLSGRYSDSGFPLVSAIGYIVIAAITGAAFGVAFGIFGGVISGVTLALGLLLAKGNRLAPAFYRNVIVGLCVTGPALIVLVSLGSKVLGPTWFFNGGNKAVAFFDIATLPAIACGISAWWATRRVVSWWEKSGRTLGSLKPRST